MSGLDGPGFADEAKPPPGIFSCGGGEISLLGGPAFCPHPAISPLSARSYLLFASFFLFRLSSVSLCLPPNCARPLSQLSGIIPVIVT